METIVGETAVTFSVLMRVPETETLVAAAATGNLGVGGWVLRSAVGYGLVATQGYSVSPIWGDQALAGLFREEAAQELVSKLTKDDLGRDLRQLSVLDAKGGVGAFTGASNTAYMGQYLGDNLVVAGNWLHGAHVLDAVVQTASKTPQDHKPGTLAHQVLASLQAGEAAGGDTRGLKSAALLVLPPDDAPINLRVDWSSAPLDDLARLLERALDPDYTRWLDAVPSLKDPYR